MESLRGRHRFQRVVSWVALRRSVRGTLGALSAPCRLFRGAPPPDGFSGQPGRCGCERNISEHLHQQAVHRKRGVHLAFWLGRSHPLLVGLRPHPCARTVRHAMTPIVLICAVFLFSDGDSGRCVTDDGVRHRVRLAGIDAGEVAPFTRCRQSPSVWACSPAARSTAGAAKARARQLAANGARCTLTDTDRYRRNVAVCTVSGRDLGLILVREGLAISETNYGDPYRSQEREARQQGRGIWQ